MRRNKKASMELSVNSIVILVIAIVIMGLILGFIREKFREVGGNLVTNEPDPQPASTDNHITLSRETVGTVPKGQVVIKSNVYNPTSVEISKANIYITCKDGNTELAQTTAADNKIQYKAGTKVLPVNSQALYIITLSIGKSVKGSYLCSVGLKNDNTQNNDVRTTDFVLQVN